MLDMSANSLLGGSLPHALAMLPALAWANFSRTAITGVLPEDWTQTALLDCSFCNLTGVLHGQQGCMLSGQCFASVEHDCTGVVAVCMSASVPTLRFAGRVIR